MWNLPFHSTNIFFVFLCSNSSDNHSCGQISRLYENLSAGMIELSAKLYEHRILQMRQIAAKHAENFANGAAELESRSCLHEEACKLEMNQISNRKEIPEHGTRYNKYQNKGQD